MKSLVSNRPIVVRHIKALLLTIYTLYNCIVYSSELYPLANIFKIKSFSFDMGNFAVEQHRTLHVWYLVAPKFSLLRVKTLAEP